MEFSQSSKINQVYLCSHARVLVLCGSMILRYLNDLFIEISKKIISDFYYKNDPGYLCMYVRLYIYIRLDLAALPEKK